MSNSKIIKIRYLHHDEWKEEDYQSDGCDQLNGVLESLGDRYVPCIMEAKEKGGSRSIMQYRNLLLHGISQVELMFEDSGWIPFNENELRRV